MALANYKTVKFAKVLVFSLDITMIILSSSGHFSAISHAKKELTRVYWRDLYSNQYNPVQYVV